VCSFRCDWSHGATVQVGRSVRLRPTSANLIKLNQSLSAENGFVPEGQHDRSQARSAWDSVQRENRPVGYGMIGRG
jgi:hypothetical protein